MTGDARTAVTAEERWHLLDEREFLVRSLADAEAEHDAGDLGDADYGLLRRRDKRRLAEVEATLQSLGIQPGGTPESPTEAAMAPTNPATDAVAEAAPVGDDGTTQAAVVRRSRWRRRRWMVLVGAAAVVAGVILLVVDVTSPRLPGEDASGSTTLSATAEVQQELEQATTLVNQNTPTSIDEALALYQAILKQEPNQPQALAESGWLEWQAGAKNDNRSLVAGGVSLVEQSLRLLPNDYAARLFLGTMLLEQDNASSTTAAVKQFRLFLSEHPPADVEASAAQIIREAFDKAGEPVPAGVPAAPSTSASGNQ